MSNGETSTQQPIGEAKTNSTNVGSSTVRQEIPGEALAYLHTGSGEIVIVPPEQSGELLTEARLLNDAVAQFHSANLAVQTLDEYRRQNYNNPKERAKADSALGKALEWQDQAYQNYHQIFMGLEPLPADDKTSNQEGSKGAENNTGEKKKEDSLKLNGTAKKLTELVSLKGLSAEERAKKKEDDKKGKMADGTYTKKLLEAKSVDRLKEIAKYPKTPTEKIIYVRRDKIQWPKMKVMENNGWKDVQVNDPKSGKTTIDRKKLRTYVADKAVKSGVSWLKKKFKENLEYSNSDTIDCSVFKVVDSWNKLLQTEQQAQLDNGPLPVGIDLGANAQLMRYSYGVSLDPDLEFSTKKISVRAEGHAEVNAAKGEAKITLYFPRKEGWVWTRTGKNGESQDIVAIVCQVTASASAVVGASIACELSIQTSANEVTATPPKLKGKPGKKGYKARRQNRMELKKGDEINPVGLDAGASVFAGAKADAQIEGGLQWRDPGDQKKHNFATIASIAPAVGGMAGLAGGLKLAIEYVRGMFRVTAHASLCFGLGAEGVLTFSVSKDEIENFCKCIFYKIAYAKFENIGIFIRGSFNVLNNMKLLAALDGSNSVLAYYGRDAVELGGDAETRLASASAKQLLAASAPDVLAYALPEAKGALICQMCKVQLASENPSAVSDAQQGILNVIRTAVTPADAANIIQHATKDGSKGVEEVIRTALESFFKLGAAGSGASRSDMAFNSDTSSTNALDSIALSGDFNGWYDTFTSGLVSELPRGFPIAMAGTPAYEVLRLREGSDHPLYTSEGWNAFYQDEA
ncbi:hypothetical protein [Burkholderia contaminans]|uniref:hypothetical protein n=1 Tax=Burkholderia contaminans TaxID=488447 RepID=UPI002D7F4442|nr:hypothetical protein [Burkholderia contaminans]